MKRFRKKRTFFVVLLITILLLFVALFGLEFGSMDLKGAKEMRYGIDIRGGRRGYIRAKRFGKSAHKCRA